MIRRHGQPDGFWGQWNNGVGSVYQNTGAGTVSGTSNTVQLGQGVDQFVAYINVNGATTITIQAAHSGAQSVDGTDPENVYGSAGPPSNAYYNLQWNATPISVTFAAAGTAAIIVPDFAPGWVRLTSSNNVGAIAGFEVSAY